MKNEAESYLKSGSNEVRILEYKISGQSFGINILKVSRIVSRLHLRTGVPDSHRSIDGIFEDRGSVIPILDLADFLGLSPLDRNSSNKVIIAEFFGVSNGFLVERVDWIHHFKWADVIDLDGVLRGLDHRYITGIVKPTEDHIVPLLDYEAIILELSPKLRQQEAVRKSTQDFTVCNKKVLVAEDSASVRAMLAAELGEVGFEVTTVSDGVAALARLKLDNSYCLVVSDIEMPRMDGLALLAAIRDGDSACDTDLPVIVYSSIGDLGMKTRAEYLKADAHITKLNIQELLDKIQDLIGDGRQGNEIDPAMTEKEVEMA